MLPTLKQLPTGKDDDEHETKTKKKNLKILLETSTNILKI